MSDKEKQFQDNLGLGSLPTDLIKEVTSKVVEKSDPLVLPSEDEHYQFKEVLAQGGLKLITILVDNRTGRSIAMAKLKPEHRKPEHIERFLREARILARLEHSNIVPIHDINYDDDNFPYFTMRLLRGGTLADLINKLREDEEYRENYPLNNLLEIFTKICDTIGYAHSESILHLDLKPENIQINEFGEVIIIDWGCAKFIDETDTELKDPKNLSLYTPITKYLTQPDSIHGTLGYIPPENISGNIVQHNPSCDIYALGAILYSLLTLKRPFEDCGEKDMIDRISRGELPDIPENAKPKSLISVVRKAMAANPAERYESAISLRDDIQSYLHGFSTDAENANFIQDLFLLVKRQRKVFSIIAVFMVLIGVITVSYQKHLTQVENLATKLEIKSDSSLDEIIEGAKVSEHSFREKNEFHKAFNIYQRLVDVGHTDSLIYYKKARLHLGNLEIAEAYDCISNITTTEDFSAYHLQHYPELESCVNELYKLSQDKTLDRFDIVKHASNVQNTIHKHLFWTLNHNPEISLQQKAEDLRKYFLHLNPDLQSETFVYKYEIEDDALELDLSGNPSLENLNPIYHLPITKLSIARNVDTNIERMIEALDHYILYQLDLSGIESYSYLSSVFSMLNSYKFEIDTLIAHGSKVEGILPKSITRLDVEGSRFKRVRMDPRNSNIKWLNIAYTRHFADSDYKRLTHMKRLKTLIISNELKIDDSIIDSIRENGVEIIVKPPREKK